MEKQKISRSKLLSHVLLANFEQLQIFPARYSGGENHCLGLAHSSRLLHGYVENTQEPWWQARGQWAPMALNLHCKPGPDLISHLTQEGRKQFN
jgi:hypothetical protein